MTPPCVLARKLLGPALASAVLISPWICRTESSGQQPRAHRLYRADLPPGALSASQRQALPDAAGYVQPVQILVPAGSRVAIAYQGVFSDPQANQLLVGLQIGHAYRLEVSHTEGRDGLKVYPTIELLDRLHPPAGTALRFPIPVELTTQDIRAARAGQLITRVIYLEDPQHPLPVAQPADTQRSFDTLPDEDPLHVAGELGRPMAILRLGSRTPGRGGPGAEFLLGCPPVVLYRDASHATHDAQQSPAAETASVTWPLHD